ncbi:hypothetical protein [Methanohalobium sp.]|uniref:hypothetical protein n=1 Tax=Methanohalobium sp. TaxID=2837493 RepID=UPI0025F58D52|nr:hypothetical protein [Methanohalobium sp.]
MINLEKGEFVKISEDEIYRVKEDLSDSTSPFYCILTPINGSGKDLKLTHKQVQMNMGNKWKKIINMQSTRSVIAGP